jgi:hypothetical protein
MLDEVKTKAQLLRCYSVCLGARSASTDLIVDGWCRRRDEGSRVPNYLEATSRRFRGKTWSTLPLDVRIRDMHCNDVAKETESHELTEQTSMLRNPRAIHQGKLSASENSKAGLAPNDIERIFWRLAKLGHRNTPRAEAAMQPLSKSRHVPATPCKPAVGSANGARRTNRWTFPTVAENKSRFFVVARGLRIFSGRVEGRIAWR